ncbi:uracil-DNA glycosylase [Psychrobacter sp. M13]|uniref:uracil-DNA glycosylase n=1 Tax=Psychrobacter sp. M13 TaxID=3067275 RepID=UPI00273AB8D1|nr:uracil-DNA glycosylase [Psychrobacter sp. M13]WLP95141.1 uracil-DNA glycosylase [Psychrobacter sp. M13]
MNAIETFVNELTDFQSTETVFNPYLNADAAKNLHIYLQEMMKEKGTRILLVGEAPGHKGCKITGIPFTSGSVFKNVNHSLLNKIVEKLVFSKIESENTATIVWEYLANKSITPLFWNSFPFHPHYEYNENKNRTPTSEEIEIGIYYLEKLRLIYNPEVIAGIGWKGVECAKKAFPDEDIVYIRHPSYGGKPEFIVGMEEILT